MNKTFPPAGYVEIETAVDGITIYKQQQIQQKEEAHQEIVEFRCPNCTAATAYSTDDGGLTCTYCGYHDAPQSEQVGRQAEEFEFTVETMHRAVHGWGAERKELQCQSCAAHTTLSTNMLTHTCPFCNSNNVIQVKAPQDVLRPRFLVPFAIKTDRCRQLIGDWLGSNWMLPKALIQLGYGTEFAPIYIPAWTFDSRAKASWDAKVKRRVGDETKWRREFGKAKFYFDDYLVFGTYKLNYRLLSQAGRYNLDDLVVYDPTYLAGIQAQAYEIPLDEAWLQARAQMRTRMKRKCKARIGVKEKEVRDFGMSLNFQDESWRYILVPVYLATYAYENKRYQVIINGQNGRIAGQRPVSWRKVMWAMLGMIAPAVLLGVLSFVLQAAGVGSFSLLSVLAYVALIGGLMLAAKILKQAQKIDEV